MLLAWQGGSVGAPQWLPHAILATFVLAGILLSGRAHSPPRLALAAIVVLLALAVWDALSAAWSPLPALARDEALLVCFYAVVLAVPALTLRSRSERTAGTIIVTGVTFALAVAAAVHLLRAEDPDVVFFGGQRLAFPIDYPNAQAAAFLVAFWPAVALAAARSVWLPARALALGAGSLFLCGWLMTQSRGAFVALLVSTVAFFAISPTRLRALLPTLGLVTVVLTMYEPLTEPFRADGDVAQREAIRTAAETSLWVAAVMTIAGLAYAVVDRRLSVSHRVRRIAGFVVAVAAAASVGLGTAAFVRSVESPTGYFADQWEIWTRKPVDLGGSYLLTAGSNRYELWRVALSEFREHPAAGVGARGYLLSYLREGTVRETPARAHSLPLDALSETGVVGFALVVALLVLLLVQGARRARTEPVVAGVVGAGAYWITHASGDWIWTVPALGVPFFLLMGIGAASGERLLPERRAFGLGICTLGAGLLLFAPPWLSDRLTTRAVTEPDLRAAAPELRWARRLDPLTVNPLLAEASLAATPAGRLPALEEVVRKEPRSSGTHLMLGRAYLDAGRVRAARRELEIAQRLAPRDDLIRRTLAIARRSG